jgi:predicted ester cyclase
VTTYKTYYGTHDGPFLGIAPTHRKIHFESVDVMRVQNGKITDHWAGGNLLSLMHQIGGWNPPAEVQGASRSK